MWNTCLLYVYIFWMEILLLTFWMACECECTSTAGNTSPLRNTCTIVYVKYSHIYYNKDNLFRRWCFNNSFYQNFVSLLCNIFRTVRWIDLKFYHVFYFLLDHLCDVAEGFLCLSTNSFLYIQFQSFLMYWVWNLFSLSVQFHFPSSFMWKNLILWIKQ